MLTAGAHAKERLTVQNARENIIGVDAMVPLPDGSERTCTSLPGLVRVSFGCC